MLQGSEYQQARMSKDARFDGTFFVAVKTTGIFCRPICPAPAPKEKNVEYYQLAAQAMQAGYRPCIRCRPDSAPLSWAWKGVDTTLERALNLLQQDPELPLTELVNKLGITDRYLRQLFKQKLGVAPKQYQLYQQVLFAKQLLQQSQIPIEQVAIASGFNSARSLQQNVQKHLRLTPSQLRSENSQNSQKIQLKLFFRPPYNWPQIRTFLALRAVEAVEHVTENSYSKHFMFKQTYGAFTATFNADINGFELELTLEEIKYLYPVLQNIKRVLDLELDVQQVQQRLMASGIKDTQLIQGLRLPGVWNTFEAGCRAILGQQISVKAAIKLLTTLTHELGHKDNEALLQFPTPEQVATSDLAFLGMPQRRKQTLKDFAAYIVQHGENSDINDWLELKGIGPWTVDYVKLRGLSQPDVWLDKDLIIKQQLAKLNLTPELAKPWRSYLTFQLWSMA